MWYSTATGEAFVNYADFCDRVFHLNKRIWACTISGKSELTFAEAMMSEEYAERRKKLLNEVLHAPVQWLMQSYDGGALEQLLLYILEQLKFCFFVGEIVEVCLGIPATLAIPRPCWLM